MARHRLTAKDVATGAVLNTFKTLMGVIAGAAKRGRLISIDIAPSGEAAQDVNVGLRISTTNQAGAGTPTTSPSPQAVDPGNPLVSGMTCGVDYSVEPTTVHATPHEFECAFNGRGGFAKRWDESDAPRWGASQTLVIQAAPGAAVAVKTTTTIVWEE